MNNNTEISIQEIKAKNDYKYYGGVNKYGKRTGFGVQKWRNNAKYIGLFKDDLADGIGKYRNAKGINLLGKNLNHKRIRTINLKIFVYLIN